MESVFSTGNRIVDENSKINFSGNVIPQAWYKTIIKENGKPNLTAIIILADIVYWYRPTEMRDEVTGQIIGIKKRFEADLLQRSYQQISEQFGISKREATNAVVELEKLGVISRVFRTIRNKNIVMNNVLYLELHVDVLKKLTYPCEDNTNTAKNIKSDKQENFKNTSTLFNKKNVHAKDDNNCNVSLQEEINPITLKSDTQFLEKVIGHTKTSDTLSQKIEEAVTSNSHTNTETTTKTTNKDYNTPILSYQLYLEQFKQQIDYDVIRHDLPNSIERLDELVGIAVDVLTSRAETIRVNKENKTVEVVKGQFSKLNTSHIRYVMNSLEEYGNKANNIRAFIITSLYNATLTMKNYNMNLVNYHFNSQYEG